MAETVEAVSSEKLGARVRDLRRRRGLTIEGLAARSGVSRAMISKLERGEKNPTLVVAAKLAEGFDVALSRLLGIDRRREVVRIPRAQRAVLRDPETGAERQLLSPAFGGGGVEFIRYVIPEGGSTGEFPPHRPGVGEHIVVERGKLRAVLDGGEHFLGEGDAIFFEADVTHRFDNVGEDACSYYLVIAPNGRG